MFSNQKAEITLKFPLLVQTENVLPTAHVTLLRKIPHILRRNSHQYGALTADFLPLVFPAKSFYAFFTSRRLANLIILDLITFIVSGAGYTNHEVPRCVLSLLSCYVITPRLQQLLHHFVLSESRTGFPFRTHKRQEAKYSL
jgi:hypothetical protein